MIKILIFQKRCYIIYIALFLNIISKEIADMEYTIRKKKLNMYYRSVKEAKSDPYWVSDGKYAASSEPVHKLHYHEMYELGICLEGSGELHVNDRVYHFKKGDIELISHYVPHHSNSDEGSPARWKLIFFDPVRIMQLAGMLDPEKALMTANVNIPFSGVFAPDEHPEIAEFIQKIIKQTEIQDEYTDISLAFSIGSFIVELARKTRNEENPDAQFLKTKHNYHKIAPAIDMINAHMANGNMIKEPALAALCNMSVPNLRRLFIKHTGISPKVYINQTRMAYAEYLLQNTNMTVLAIASKVGYSEVSGFNRIFNMTFGKSPSEYRKSSK